MAQIFTHSATSATWPMTPLAADCLSLSRVGQDIVLSPAPPAAPWPALLRRSAAAGPPQWLCLATSDALAPRVNGDPVIGFRILAHRDVVEVAGTRLIFSTETPAVVETFAGPPGVRCPRCQLELAAGELMVRCPACGTIHHALADRPCWTYSPKCAVCSQTTALSSAPAWTPEEL